ncbi:glycosyltransferase family 2 protein [Streptomyces sp. NBC_00669]|uniref:glycosyltransferase family 2 protein n=1 Tax=Streptomyces sp. NBC_00669 TaxID=2976011 RepID=UPI002E333632|nr:glycosyltransferase family 2 protein [Streptomyces sp. NBC_00669]
MKRVTKPAPAADIVLPCLDEAAALPWVLGRIPPGWRAIVVDNGSTDGSARIAGELGALVVREPVRGFGSACDAGLRAATAELVCFCDCDGSLDPALLKELAAPVLAGSADLVLGRRRPTSPRAWPPHARLANLQLARLVRRRTGLRLHDLGPMRVARRAALLDLELTDRRSGYPLQMVVRAADAGWRITEADVPYTPRSGRSKVTGTWRGTWHAVRDMSAVLQEPAAPALTTLPTGPAAPTVPATRPAAACPPPAAPAAASAGSRTGEPR